MLNPIISIRNNKKRPDLNSIVEYINRELRNSNITHNRVETKLSLLTVGGKLDTKYRSGKTSYSIIAESDQDLSSAKTVEDSSSTAAPVASPFL